MMNSITNNKYNTQFDYMAADGISKLAVLKFDVNSENSEDILNLIFDLKLKPGTALHILDTETRATLFDSEKECFTITNVLFDNTVFIVQLLVLQG